MTTLREKINSLPTETKKRALKLVKAVVMEGDAPALQELRMTLALPTLSKRELSTFFHAAVKEML